jgi:hypothetical protein
LAASPLDVEEVHRPQAWHRIGPIGRFMVGVVIAMCVAVALVWSLERAFALLVSVPTVDQLPDRVAICGRNYHRRAGGPQDLLTLDGVRATGIEPVVVLPLRMQPCIDGPCNRGWPGRIGCATVVFVRVQGDRYAAYSLVGGP